MKFVITLFVLAVLAQVSLYDAAPYGYTLPQNPEPTTNSVATTEPQPQVTPVSGKPCGCGSGCQCGSAGSSSSCGCKGTCTCGQPKPAPKPACGCGSGCSCSAQPGAHNCGCKKQASPPAVPSTPSALDRLRALLQSRQY